MSQTPNDISSKKSNPAVVDEVKPVGTRSIWGTVQAILNPFASLRLTVVCFLLAIIIILVGTLAQVKDDIWTVVREYFRVDFQKLFVSEFPFIHLQELFVWVRLQLFFPPSFFPDGGPNFTDKVGFWFPKGWPIGALMLVNLLAAHTVRFKVQAKGSRLVLGWIVILLGALVTYGVILSGSSGEGLQTDPLISYTTLWWMIESTLFGLCALAIYSAIVADKSAPERRWLFGGLAVLLAVASFYALQSDGSDQAIMRILYQLIKATLAGLVLLAGCIVVFKKRAGIVLLHAGIGLMMAYDVLVGVRHVESQMYIIEGQSTQFSRDTRAIELAIIDRSADESDEELTLDSKRLQPVIDKDGKPQPLVISDESLPFKIDVLEYYPNSNLLGPRQPVPDGVPAENPATAGIGKQIRAVPAKDVSGTDSSGMVNVPSAYLKLTDPHGHDLGVYLVSAHFDQFEVTGDPNLDEVDVHGKLYDISLRFKRLYHDYIVTLKDVQKNDYKGTDNPRDYSSFIEVQVPQTGETFEHHIWMNNPMRFAGKTFYQSKYFKLDNGEMTALQVVDNAGWMTPYVACMMVVVAMMYHFVLTLLRFLNRRFRETRALGEELPEDQITPDIVRKRAFARRMKSVGRVVAAVLVLAVGAKLASDSRPPRETPDAFHLQAFGELPMWYKGRAMPLDAYARNTLMQFSDYQTYRDADDHKHPAIQWLIELLSSEEKAGELRIFRIENEEVQKLLGLEPRERFNYSITEIRKSGEKLMELASSASKIPPANQSIQQRKILELAQRVIFYGFLERTLGPALPLPASKPAAGGNSTMQMATRAQEYFEYLRRLRSAATEYSKQFNLGPMPLVVPTHLGTEDQKKPNIEELNPKWETASVADIYRQFYNELPFPKSPAIEQFTGLLQSYRDGDVAKFNTGLAEYQTLLAKYQTAEDLPVRKVSFEAWFSRMSPFDLCSAWYVVAGVLALLGWLFWPEIFQRSSFWLLVLIFVLHTGALLGRIYISGRPPVTNLYSSAVFIGWAVVLGSLIIERLTKLGIGNVVAATAGFLTLRIAAGLAAEGDTYVVQEAVLDTQFWLATHVVCITLGYATTYLAGFFGLLYLLLGMFTPKLTPHVEKELSRMIYGVTCFSIFFSFWGTVLGGLWADDSWGRFWGWDPKENGALIIVLWNALLLHARWGKMVGDRGVAILAVLGNVVVSWSWFGVNELGVGLHTYGFTEGRLMMLMVFCLSQVVISLLALVPQRFWVSRLFARVKE